MVGFDGNAPFWIMVFEVECRIVYTVLYFDSLPLCAFLKCHQNSLAEVQPLNMADPDYVLRFDHRFEGEEYGLDSWLTYRALTVSITLG